MPLIPTTGLDFTLFWTCFLISIRMLGLMQVLPGIGTEQSPMVIRVIFSVLVGAITAAAGVQAPSPETLAEGGLMIATEYVLGVMMGMVPAFIMSAMAVSGQVIAGAIGLGQANMIDPSLGGNASVFSRLGTFVFTIVFLAVDGHHAVLRAATGAMMDPAVGLFRPGQDVADLFVDRFREAFHLSLTMCAPVLVTVLVTQFVLGLITKFIPQVNIFIISFPLTIFIGLYITAYTFPGMVHHALEHIMGIEETLGSLLLSRAE